MGTARTVLQPGQQWPADEQYHWRTRWNALPVRYPRIGYTILGGPSAFRCELYSTGHDANSIFSWTTSDIDLGASYWFIALLFAILPAWRFGGSARRRRRYRLVHGLCINCGYDLRATPEAHGPLLDRCPECGSEAHVSAPSG